MWTNGAVIYIDHLAHTLRDMGHSAQLVEKEELAGAKCDYFWFQSEWYDRIKGELATLRAAGVKTICFFGHFLAGENKFPDPHSIVADHFVSMWKGPLIDSFNKNVIYFPHAFCTSCRKGPSDTGSKFHGKRILWSGNAHAMRDEGIFASVRDKITPISNVAPCDLNEIYSTATACLNLHGDAQKGIITGLTPLKAYAFNERFFHVMGAGGFQVCDDHPLIKETGFKVQVYGDNLGAVLDSVEKLRREEDIIENQEKVLANHTYFHRLTDLMKKIQ